MVRHMRKFLDNAEAYICAALFLGMTAIGFVNVVVRYLTSYSFAATQEFLLAGFLLLTVFGAALAARKGEHLAVTLFTDLLPQALRRPVRILAALLSLALLLLTVWYCFELVRYQRASGVVSSGLQIPAWYYSAALPFGFLLVAIRVAQRAILELRHPERTGEIPDV